MPFRPVEYAKASRSRRKEQRVVWLRGLFPFHRPFFLSLLLDPFFFKQLTVSKTSTTIIQFINTLSTIGSLASCVLAHTGHGAISKPRIQSRCLVNKRCASAVGTLSKRRYNKRNALRKRDIEARLGNATDQNTTDAPSYEVIQNDTCILTPGVTEGPYVGPRPQTLRQDMTEEQPGVPFTLDVGLIDIKTCEQLEKALVSFWHCNVSGGYSSFTGLSPSTIFETLLD
jgi:hypothetical protein